jgi:glycerate kinase
VPLRAIVVGQAFKGSLSAREVARALAAGVEAARLPVTVVVGSDGGDGFLDAVAPPRRVTVAVTGPRGAPVEAEYGWLDPDTAVIESRLACGLALLGRGERDPAVTTTRGVGDLIVAAAGAGARTVIVGLGGSATMDGGLGAARAWGWQALDAAGTEVPEGGGSLSMVARLVPAPAPPARLVAVTDVTNRLLGPDGAAVYAPQKGASRDVATALAAGLAHLVELCRPWNGPELAEQPGAGAAGGLGFGLMCFGGATARPGAPWVLERTGFDAALDGAALVVTAEATVDATSFTGKLMGEVVARARRRGVPVAILTPRALTRPSGVTLLTRPGRWRAKDLTQLAERAARQALRLPRR